MESTLFAAAETPEPGDEEEGEGDEGWWGGSGLADDSRNGRTQSLTEGV